MFVWTIFDLFAIVTRELRGIMMEYDKRLNLAIKLLDNTWVYKDSVHRFTTIFPFTNVNIADSFSEFNFQDKSFLTIGSSCDPVINAAYLGSKDQTIIDICPFTQDYFWLKKATHMSVDRKEFKDYLCYRSYFPHLVDNRNALNPETFEKITPYLRKSSYESYLFWKNLFEKYSLKKRGEHLRRTLFTLDEESGHILDKTNLYLEDDESYLKAREAMRSVVPTIIEADIYEYEGLGNYDNINIANLAQFATSELAIIRFKSLVERLAKSLNIDGTMLVAYLFDTTLNSPYTGPIIFDIPATLELLKEYVSKFITFTSPCGILWEDDRKPDSAIIYKKTIK